MLLIIVIVIGHICIDFIEKLSFKRFERVTICKEIIPIHYIDLLYPIN